MNQVEEKLKFLEDLCDNSGWEGVSNSDGVCTERRFFPDSGYACFRSYGLVTNSPDVLAEFVWKGYNDFGSMKSHDSDVTLYNIIESNDNYRVCHQINSLQWPIWPRELVYYQTCITRNDNIYILMYSTESNSVPRQDDKYVRATINISGYVFKPHENGCMVYRIAHIEPNGSIPASIINGYADKTTHMIRTLKKI